MPASTLDPVNEALHSALSKGSCSSSLEEDIAGSTKKILLNKIEFEADSSYQNTQLPKSKYKHVILEVADEGKKEDKSENNNTADDGLKSAKHELYPLKSVQLGWKNISKWGVGAGMLNMGNTCYLNSTLQALFHVPAFANWLSSDRHGPECENAGLSACIICSMRKTLEDSHRTANAIRPFLIVNKLRNICRNLIPGRQEDAHEFLRCLVEAMEKAYLLRFKNISLDLRTKETTPLNQILGGYLRSNVRCQECGNVSTTFQHFQDLLLDIRKIQTLDEALESFFSVEKLDDESYHCETCRRKVPALKQFVLERPPMVLCIQLKRFSITNSKISKSVQFRQRIDLTKFIRKRYSNSLTYKMVALVSHFGPTSGCGHYTSIAQAPSGNYYQFDDSSVKQISHQAVFNTNAYIMFYELESLPIPITNGKLKNSAISAVTKQDKEESSTLTNHINGDSKSYRTMLSSTKFQKPVGIGQNGTSPTLNGNNNSLKHPSKCSEKENKPIPSSTQTSPKSDEVKVNGEIAKVNGSATQNFFNNSHSSKSVISSSNISSTSNNLAQQKSKEIQSYHNHNGNSQQLITKLVPYERDDSSDCSEDADNANNSDNNTSVPTNGNGDWKVTSLTDSGIDSEPTENGSEKSEVVSELLKMSHNGYSAPVMSWNGKRSQVDEEITSERNLDRKRTLADISEQGRVKRQKINSHASTSIYNPIQEYHSSKNWNPNNGAARYRFYNSNKRHRNDRRNYHHKNYHKNHRFRH